MAVLKPLFVVAIIICSAAASRDARSQERSDARTALIIGNGTYSNARLANPGHDARGMADVLRAGGFDVTLKIDADQKGMRDAIWAFGATLKARKGVGLLYYAGHGVQLRGENYILPLGNPFYSEAALRAGAITAA